ncbi:hypothetical protein ABZ299_33485 [Streptomyces sp. NPDC006184]|uniref:hypothetical protein n=1 Tax=Streptomyces sp. NPDC006184 TaxID=3155455 RepID=UPI0033BB5348
MVPFGARSGGFDVPVRLGSDGPAVRFRFRYGGLVVPVRFGFGGRVVRFGFDGLDVPVRV